jgi:hypothetical protein
MEQNEGTTHRIRDELISALRVVRGTAAKIEYDGYGDDGAIEDITVLDEEGNAIDLDATCHADDPSGGNLVQRLDELTCELLEILVPGWEINEGSCGTLTIDVNRGTASLHHSARYMASTDEEYEV